MKVAFRLDASEQIGTGHFFRCLTIANRLQQKGASSRFVSYPLPQSLIDLLEQLGHEYYELFASIEDKKDSPDTMIAHHHWIPSSQQIDAQKTIQSLAGLTWDYMIVDHYALSSEWESALKPYVNKILVIDDLADRQHDCDFLVDQNYYADYKTRYQTKVSPHCQLLLGPQYALLRDDFLETTRNRDSFSPNVKEILVFMGGVDAGNYTIKVLNALLLSELNTCSIHVVIGQSHPDVQGIQEFCRLHGFFCHVQTKNMANLMKSADMAIGAGGISVWERAYFGLPTITIELAENQRKQLSDAAIQGLVYCPDLNKDQWELDLADHIRSLIHNPYLREHISKMCQQSVDGQGVTRVVDKLTQTIQVRKATLNDLDLLFTWRNHPKIRSVSKNPELISYEEHSAWFKKAIGAEHYTILVASFQTGQDIGVIRFHQQGTYAEISIYLDPEMLHQGIGAELLRLGEKWMLDNCSWLTEFRATVLGENMASHRLFQKAAYSKDETIYFKKVKHGA